MSHNAKAILYQKTAWPDLSVFNEAYKMYILFYSYMYKGHIEVLYLYFYLLTHAYFWGLPIFIQIKQEQKT